MPDQTKRNSSRRSSRNQNIEISRSQLADQPWTPEQIRAAQGFGLYTAALLILWLIRLAIRRR